MDGFQVIPYYVSELSDKIRIGELESGALPERENEIAVQGAMLEKMGVAPAVGSEVALDFYDGNTETFTVTGILKGGETAKQFAVFFSKSYADNGSQLKDSTYEVYAKLYGAETMHPEDCREAMYLIGSDAGVERKNVNPSKAFIDSLSVDTQDILTYGMIGCIAGYFIIPSGFSVINTLLIALCVFAVIYIITMMSVHKPAKLAAAVSPMEALRYVPQDDMKQTANRKMCRSLTPFGLGVMNFSKNKKKAVVTMLSLALGGILFMTAATYMSSFNKENYSRQGNFADAEFDISYSVSATGINENGLSGLQAEKPLDEQTVKEILAIDGVEAVEELKNFGIRFDYPKQDEYDNDDMVYPLTEEELNGISKYIEEGSADPGKLMSGDYVLVAGNTNVEEIYGWRFRIGDVLTFHYYDGTKMAEKEVTVLGLLNDQYTRENTDLMGWFLMPEQAILDFVSYDTLNETLLVSTDPVQEAAVGEVLTQIVSERPELDMETLADRKIADAQSVNTIFGAISGLSVFIMMFSILSMMNTLITNIVTRKQKLAMLESIGMAKGQIRKMLLGESLMLVLATVGVTMTIGTLCGYALSKALYNIGAYYMAFKFPAGFALAYAAVLIAVPLVITVVSMRSFSKEALVERLKGAEC